MSGNVMFVRCVIAFERSFRLADPKLFLAEAEDGIEPL
jgi:hypothetical protein